MKSKMNFGTWARNALLVGGCLATAAACGDTAFAAGEWDVSFAEEGATLKLTHRPSGIEMSGELAFLGPEKATDAAADPKADWKVGVPRDGVPRPHAAAPRARPRAEAAAVALGKAFRHAVQ